LTNLAILSTERELSDDVISGYAAQKSAKKFFCEL